MVRVISLSTLGYDDYGGHFSDREVDGVDYSDTKDDRETEVVTSTDPKDKTVKAVKLKGGRKL